tara:strand:+ start:355 stop:492 length:138 start_codon:yes stop_codon:yes gene_type:complete
MNFPNEQLLEECGIAAGECILLIYSFVKKICCCKSQEICKTEKIE